MPIVWEMQLLSGGLCASSSATCGDGGPRTWGVFTQGLILKF